MLTLTMNSVPERVFKPLPAVKEHQPFRPSPKKRRLKQPRMVNPNDTRAGLRTSKPRSSPVLDAFAELITYMISPNHCNVNELQKDKEEPEQVATAFRISPSGERVHLVIAASGITKRHVQSFHRIWRILRTISRSNGKAPESILDEHYHRVVREVYTMCYDATYKQIFHQWGEQVLLHPDMKRPSVLGNRSNLDKLARIFTCVERCQHFFHLQNTGERSEEIEDIKWRWFTTWISELTSLTHEVCSVKSLCESWASLCDHYSPPPIRQAIENLTALHRAINIIINFAMHPFHNIFASDLDVILVPLDYPSWNLSPIHPPNGKGSGITVGSGSGGSNNSLGLAAHSIPKSAAHTHAPRALIEYLEYDRIYASAPPALSCIGLSRPCCSQCEEWISVTLPRCFVDAGSSVICGHYITRTVL